MEEWEEKSFVKLETLYSSSLCISKVTTTESYARSEAK